MASHQYGFYPVFTHDTMQAYDVILVVVDKLTKVAHFIPRSLRDESLALAKKFV